MSTSDIDLLYFTNNNARKMMVDKGDTRKNDINKTDKKFYRKRILQLTKELLKKEGKNNIINESFNAYIKTAIDFFQFIDKEEIMQEEYKDLEEKKRKDSNKEFKSIDSDKLMMKEIKNKTKDNIKNFAIITNKKKKEKLKTPKQKEINLKTDKLKNKGVKKKKSK
jgi:hypothetical protein